MIKSRIETILNSRVFYICLFIVCSIFFLINNSIERHSVYKLDDTEFTGTLKKIVVSESKVALTIDNKNESLICNYYIKENSEQKDYMEEYKLGYTLKITGSLNEPPNNTVPNTFNYKEYLYRHNTFYTCTIKKIDIIDNQPSIFYKLKNAVVKRIMSFDIKDYLYTMIIGDKSLLDNETYEKYRQNGVTHLFAISGMHVGLFSAFLLKILKKVKKKKRYLFVISFIWLYAFLAGFSPSVTRSCLLFTLISIFKILEIEVDTLKVLFITCFILIIHNYNIVYDIGFIYSITTTFGLIYSKKVLSKHKLIGTSLVATLYSLPITVNNFYKFNLLSPIFNLLFVPFVSVVIYPLCLLTLVFRFLEPITKLGIMGLELLNDLSANLNFLYLVIPKLNIIIVIIYYLILLLYLKKGFYKTSIILFSIILLNKTRPFLVNSYHVDYLDVGQGDSALIRTKRSEEVILIDTGGKETFGSTKSNYHVSDNTITYLNSLGIEKIDLMILTHGDYDHMGEALYLVDNLKVKKVIFNCGSYNNLEKELISVLECKNIKYNSCINELKLSNAELNFLQTKEYDNENDNSTVIYTELDNYKFLFMGDASISTEKEILNKYDLPNIDVLKVGHHGSKTSSDAEFVNKISPKYSVISVGKNNRYGHPNKEALESLNKTKIYRTDNDGSIIFKIDNSKLDIKTCKPYNGSRLRGGLS